jgi:glutamate-ammonia-ligase adenylyltransferase
MKRSRDMIERELCDLIEYVTHATSTMDVHVRLKTIGIHASQGLADLFVKVAERLGGPPGTNDNLATLLLNLFEAPHPSGALVNFLRYLETSGATRTFLDTAGGGKPLREILATVLGTSQYMADIVIRNPGYLYWLIGKQAWEKCETKSTYLTELMRDVENFHSVDAQLNAVRRLQRRMLLKIGVQDLVGATTIEETTRALSELADAVTECVLRVLWRDSVGSDPDEQCGFAVLALGKLGGGELNYSSDIDLIYLCADEDEETITRYHKLSRRLTTSIGDLSGEGYLYRVDLRLRPDGDVGPLVSPLSSMMVYYENRGRPWEFQAMLKARVIAGDAELGKKFLQRISALTFNPSQSYSPMETISLMRARIRENISSRDRAYNIKLMEGGIRDIEFIVHMLHLTHGGHHPDLRVTGTITGIEQLWKKRLIKKLERDTLLAAYTFFRLVEHRLQMMHQLQTHSIPQSVDDVSLLARRISKGPLGNFGHDDFLATLTTHLNKVRVLSDSFFEGTELPEASVLLLLPGDDDITREVLTRFRHTDPGKALSIIQSLAYGSFPDLLDRGSRAAFQKLLPRLLEDLSDTPDPTKALVRFSRIIGGAPNRAALYDYLAESTPARSLLRDLVGSSSLLCSKLSKQTNLLNVLSEAPGRVLEQQAFESIRWQALRGPGDDSARTSEHIRRDIDRRELAAWVLDMDRGTLPRELAAAVTTTTRTLVTAAFDSVMESSSGVAVFALGSFGVREPRPGSDVDLLVITKDRDLEPVTRAIQALTQMLTDNNILKLDFRLRGEGASAPLVQDIAQYERYFNDRMAHWERIALGKCAHWCGDEALAAEFVNLLTPHVLRNPDADHIRALTNTRSKLEQLVTTDAATMETKRSAGGRYDIEYLCAIGMACRGEPFDLDLATDRRLDLLASSDLITVKERERLAGAAALFSRVEYLLELQELPAPTSAERARETLHTIEKTLALLGMAVENGLADVLSAHKSAVRECYNTFIKRISTRK